ncbi:MAG: flagellar assembly protein J [Candidatus Methanofastidiosum methylothiophilum]|jgi:flagellar protein FlaJ|uniref:Flagellar assembly protein J n=1 Tax=Candidatus Methanofastidiosum methylothiophilum TaxID=1705564 RepID=A0A150JIW3_9EURY|nr:MAG: flagellar assembly protein J [Candidatus Methanofastidiosum methylthiophilus]KYC57189.1 MAG: flagellar assembly protein J [Candidatus Methanofastidiosum methylthiophilus]KYC57945.1 MAG: flagellar assembly protein J [Candidatus Methanofastidiosum methylthiophilus]OQC49904.1 MAG: flagellar assembly protein J [Euryarchaeota archaeon ADurb.Bin023]HPU91494.1 type II secretion system F family protein [Methanofastidiosum sp.]
MLGKKKEKNFAVQEIERYEKRGFFMNYGKMAHKRFGFLINNRLNAFEELHDPLRKGDIPLNLGAYVSAMMLTTVIVGALSLIISIIIVPLFLGGFVSGLISSAKPLDFISNLLLIILIPLLTSVSTFMIFWTYPSFKAGERARKINLALTNAVNTMATIAGTGVPPAIIFWSLVEFRRYGEVSRESEKILNDIENFGLDLVQALQRAANRSPSPLFSELLWKMIATIRTGGNLKEYLYLEGNRLMEIERMKTEAAIETIGILAEAYVTALVVGPVFIIIMTTIMGIMGTSMSQVNLINNLVVYFGLPIGYAIFIIAVDQVAPKR